MYRIILIIVIALFLIRTIWMFRAGKWNLILLKNAFKQGGGQLFKWLMMSEFRNDALQQFKLFFVSVSLVSFIILALTGLIPVILFGESMGGLFLIMHVTIAPFFVLALMFSTIFMGHFQQFDNSDYNNLKKLRVKKEIKNPDNYLHHVLSKLCFWFFLVFSVPAILSIILSMFPYFGTEGQIAMLNIHRYSTLVLLIIALCSVELKMKTSKRSTKEKQVIE
jgi:hypothetical protein